MKHNHTARHQLSKPSKSTQVTTEEAPTTVQAPKVETEMKSQEDLPSEKLLIRKLQELKLT